MMKVQSNAGGGICNIHTLFMNASLAWFGVLVGYDAGLK